MWYEVEVIFAFIPCGFEAISAPFVEKNLIELLGTFVKMMIYV